MTLSNKLRLLHFYLEYFHQDLVDAEDRSREHKPSLFFSALRYYAYLYFQFNKKVIDLMPSERIRQRHFIAGGILNEVNYIFPFMTKKILKE